MAKKTGDKKRGPATDFFWSLAAEQLSRGEQVDEGSLMGFPCLRVDGGFFCTCDHRDGALIVKLPAPRVRALIDDGIGEAFAPAGRVFREWLKVRERDAGQWRALMDEARGFVGGEA